MKLIHEGDQIMKAIKKNLQIVGHIILLTALMLTVSGDVLGSAQHITMIVGQQRMFDARGIAYVNVGLPDVANAQNLPATQQVVVYAISRGVTTVTFIDQQGVQRAEYVITVLAQDPHKLRDELQVLLREVEGIETRIIGDNVFIDGSVFRERDLERINTVAEALGEQVKVLATFDDSYVPPVANIEIQIDVLEVSKEVAAKYGLSLSSALDSIGGGVNFEYKRDRDGTTTGGLEWKLFGDLGSVLDLTASDGASKHWHRERLITTNGSEGEFKAGGFLVFETSTPDRAGTIERIYYGSLIKATPRLYLGRMLIDIDVEMSSIDSAASARTDGIPAIKTKHVTTNVSMNEGESIVLAGVVERVDDDAYSKVPLLGDVPILGYLFKSRQFRRGETEAIIVLTPRVVSSSDPSHTRKLQEMQRLFNQ
jgi:pilus assembly protein CpaC